jgi:CheY-like chemotaxis protein
VNLRRRPETAQIPIVVVSGNLDALAHAGMHVGGRGTAVLLRKLFTLAELQAAVRQAMGPASENVS